MLLFFTKSRDSVFLCYVAKFTLASTKFVSIIRGFIPYCAYPHNFLKEILSLRAPRPPFTWDLSPASPPSHNICSSLAAVRLSLSLPKRRDECKVHYYMYRT
jgi:hypothetical protein